MHTGKPGFKHREKRPDLKVEYIHMSALLGFVMDIVISAVMGMDGVDGVMKSKVSHELLLFCFWLRPVWELVYAKGFTGYQGFQQGCLDPK